jgi:cysteine-rich repeat protein
MLRLPCRIRLDPGGWLLRGVYATSRRRLTWTLGLGVVLGACDPGAPAGSCDEGVAGGGDACDRGVRREGPACGNGRVEDGEVCDLGFANGPAGPCRADCRAPRCGDGVPDEGERCDDGNRDDHDACRSDCRPAVEAVWVRAPAGGDRAASVLGLALDLRGGAVAVGYGQAAPEAPLRAWVAGYGRDGDERWARWLPQDDTWSSATARAVAVDAAGDVWVAGDVHGEHDDDVWVARCDPEGTPRWSWTEDLAGHRDRGVALALHAGGVVVAGETLREAHDRDGLVLALDGDGQRRWTWRHDGPAGVLDDARAVVVTADGGVVVGGGEDDLTAWWLAKLDGEGNAVGVTRARGQVGAWVSALAVDVQGDLWVAGTEVLDAPKPTDASTWHAQPWLARLDAAGGVRWRVVEPPEPATRREAFAVVLDPGGGATVVGTDPIPEALCTRMQCLGRLWLAAYAADGTRRYVARPDEMTRGEGRAALRDAEGLVWLAGSRRLVYFEADAWLGRYREAPTLEAGP